MQIRGVGPSSGAQGPNMDPQTQALADVNSLERLMDLFRADMEKGDMSAMQKDLQAMAGCINDLHNLSSQLPPNIVELIDVAAGQLKQMQQSIEQITPQKFAEFEGTVDTLRDLLKPH